MSSNNEAFVKTFSRRNRLVGNPSSMESKPTSIHASASAESQIVRVDEPQVIAPTLLTGATAEATVRNLSFGQRSTDQRLADQAEQQERIMSLQHTHTAYASIAIDPAPLMQPQTAPAAGCATKASQQSQRAPVTERFDTATVGPPSPHQKSRNSPVPVGQPARRVEPFQAVWEVDVFDIPARVADLFFDGKRYQQIAERMSDAVKTGLQSVLVTSSQSGEGRSTVAIGIAMAAAATGIRVALIDADTQSPTLADDLRLDLQYGWVDTVRGGLPIKEIAVHAVEDGVTLIPLMPPVGRTEATAYEVTQLIDSLKDKFELLVIDGPSFVSSAAKQIAATVDSAILVRDVRRTEATTISDMSERLLDAGVQGVGIVDNFV